MKSAVDPNTLPAEVDALKRLQAESRRRLHPTLDALLPAILPPSPCFGGTGDRAFIRLHPISAGQEGEL